MFCQSSVWKVLRPWRVIWTNFCSCSTDNKAKKQKWTKSRVNLSSLFESGKKNVQDSCSYQEMVRLRHEEAKRSVLVNLTQGTSEKLAYQHFGKQGQIKTAFQFSDKKNYMLIEFEEEAMVKKIIKEAGHLKGKDKLPVQSRVLSFSHVRSGSDKTDSDAVSYPIIYGDLASHDIPNFSSLNCVSEQIAEHHRSVRLTNLETRLRFFICSMIEDMVSGFLSQVQVVPFGSSVNGFGLHNCDLDMVFQLMSTHRKTQKINIMDKVISSTHNRYSLKSLALFGDMLYLFMPCCQDVVKVLRARVPIIKFTYEVGRVDCDLTSPNVSGAKMSELLYIFGESDPRVRPLVSVLKYWARTKGVTKKAPGPWPSSFVLLMLMIHFLQTCKILPSIRTMQQLAGHQDKFHIDGVLYSFVTDIRELPETDNKQSLEELLVDFFTYFVNFDFEKHGISIIEGSVFLKQDISSMYIENPFSIGVNMSKNVARREVQRLQAQMEIDLRTLNSNNSAVTSGPWGVMSLVLNEHESINRNISITELYEETDIEQIDISAESGIDSNVLSTESAELSPPVSPDVEQLPDETGNAVSHDK